MRERSRRESSTRPGPAVRGVVLCGGAGARLGRPKAEVRVGSRTLLARATALLRAATGRAPWISLAYGTAPASRAHYADRAPGRGPAEGVAAGLARLGAGGGALLVISVDMPLLTVRDLYRLIDAYGRDPEAVVATYRGRVQPMCCILPATVLPVAERAAAAGWGVRWILERTHARAVSVPRRNGGSPFRSVNTPRDLADIIRRVRQ